MRRVLVWLSIGVLAVAAVLTTLTFTYFWRSPSYYLDVGPVPGEDRIIPKREYLLGHAQPYVYEADNALIFGSTHTKDPGHPELAQIEQQWRRFKPTVALVEGRLGFLIPGFMNPVREYGEMGRVNALAKVDDIPSYTWEFPWDQVASELAGRFPPEQVALYFVLRPYFSNLRFGKPESPEKFIEEFIHRGTIPALGGTISSVADVDRIWLRDFPNERDWRDVSSEGPLIGYLNEVGFASEDLRNLHLVRVVKTLVSQGNRVFVICGSSHAVVIEPALR